MEVADNRKDHGRPHERCAGHAGFPGEHREGICRCLSLQLSFRREWRPLREHCDHLQFLELDKFDNAPRFTENAHYYGGAVTPDPREQAKGWLQAIDATTGTMRWRRQWPTPPVGGVTVTSGGMLFTGDLNNDFLAIDASNGKTLYHFNTGGSIGGGIISYELEGKQYVATTSGVVSGFFGGSGTSAIIVFSLP